MQLQYDQSYYTTVSRQVSSQLCSLVQPGGEGTGSVFVEVSWLFVGLSRCQ